MYQRWYVMKNREAIRGKLLGKVLHEPLLQSSSKSNYGVTTLHASSQLELTNNFDIGPVLTKAHFSQTCQTLGKGIALYSTLYNRQTHQAKLLTPAWLVVIVYITNSQRQAVSTNLPNTTYVSGLDDKQTSHRKTFLHTQEQKFHGVT